MRFLEKNLEDIIFETDNVELRKRGMWIIGKKKRQVKIGNYGVCDIVTYKRHINEDGEQGLFINVFELKQDKINAGTLIQAGRYVRGIERYIDQFRCKCFPLTFRITLVGQSIDTSDFCYMPAVLNNVSVYTFNYAFDGITFNDEDGYSLKNEGFF